MIKYKVKIQPPTSKRMTGTGILTVSFESGWGGSRDPIIKEIDSSINEFVFSVSDDCEWIGSRTVWDGDIFYVKIKYTNSTNTREESISLKPERIDD